jgi:hypothetical protein
LFATKFFPRGSVVYIGRDHLIPNEKATFQLVMKDFRTYVLDSDTHSVAISETHRKLYLFDSFMNHSCDPNTFSAIAEGLEAQYPSVYATTAIYDIHPGDQISCDYNLFEYDMAGKEIWLCGCGSERCLGEVRGYKFLPEALQCELVDQVEENVIEWFANDNPRVTYTPALTTPDTVEVK